MSREKQIEEMTCEKCLHYEMCLEKFRNAKKDGFYEFVDEEEYFSHADECDFFVTGYRKRSEGEWISVRERLPENDWGKHWKERKYYLVFTKPSGLMNVAVYGYKEHDWWIDRNSCVLDKKNYKEVTHWMPLPEPPVMKGE